MKKASEFLVEIEYSELCQALLPIANVFNKFSNGSFYELQQVYCIWEECSSPSVRNPGMVGDTIFQFRLKCVNHLVAFYQSNLIMVYSNIVLL